jgi:hypothetical protein
MPYEPSSSESCVIDQYADMRNIPLPSESIDVVVAFSLTATYSDEVGTIFNLLYWPRDRIMMM